MHRTFRPIRLLLFIAPLLLGACSVKQNTAFTRKFHAFNTRYNIYYNAQVAYKEGSLAKESGMRDDFTELLPLFSSASPGGKGLGKAQFETAITKCEKAIKLHSIKRKPVMDRSKKLTPRQKLFLSLKEYNPFLKNVWLLMGKSQFEKGEFVEAAATFSYITRLYAEQPEVLSQARAWLARCYAQMEWFYDAEDVIRRLRRDSVDRKGQKELDATMADLLIRQQHFEEALPYLQRTLKREHRRKTAARGYFLLAQIERDLGHTRQAYKALSKVIRRNPSYEVAFNARIMQTEVLSGHSSDKSLMRRLRRMARSDNNQEFLDQIYYAMGNISLRQGDTLTAIKHYEKGVEKGTRQGVERGVLLLRLGDVYWARQDFTSARRCYTAALGLVEKEKKAYEQLSFRSKVLDELEPFTSVVVCEDSLQNLCQMSEDERNTVIDKAIADLKKREKEARRNSADSLAREQRGQGSGEEAPATQTQPKNGEDNVWYFYNPQVVAQGKESFRRYWGERKNEDDWRRANRTVLAPENTAEEEQGEELDTDSLVTDSIAADSLGTTAEASSEKQKKKKDLAPEDDPHKREYYLKDLPFSPEAKQRSDSLIANALFSAAVIEKDKLHDLPLARASFARIIHQYDTLFHEMDKVYYNLFLLEGMDDNPVEMEHMRTILRDNYPESELTSLVLDPDYERKARYGKHLEDSLYVSAYEAFRRGDMPSVLQGAAVSLKEYPKGDNRARFMFIEAVAKLKTEGQEPFTEELKKLVETFPSDKISELAGMILRGLEEGRAISPEGIDFSSLWERRAEGGVALADSLAKAQALSTERDVPFRIILAYPLDSVNENHLLYEVARFGFTEFAVRNFEISKEKQGHYGQMHISGFRSFDEAVGYARALYALDGMKEMRNALKMVIISEGNFQKIGTQVSLGDYLLFYEQHFKPLFVRPDILLDKDENVFHSDDVLPKDSQKKEEKKQQTEEEEPLNENEYYDIDDKTPEKDDTTVSQEEEEGTIIEDDATTDEGEWYDF